VGNSLATSEPVNFSRRTLQHAVTTVNKKPIIIQDAEKFEHCNPDKKKTMLI